jgi:hypothetical protein
MSEVTVRAGGFADYDCPKCQTPLSVGPPSHRVYVSRNGANIQQRVACPKCFLAHRIYRGRITKHGVVNRMTTRQGPEILLAQVRTPSPAPATSTPPVSKTTPKASGGEAPAQATVSEPEPEPEPYSDIEHLRTIAQAKGVQGPIARMREDTLKRKIQELEEEEQETEEDD